MGKQYSEDTIKELKDGGFYRFVAIFTWTGQDDDVAFKRLLQYSFDRFNASGIHAKTTQGYYLTGARTVIVIGHVDSPIHLQHFCSSIIRNTPIQANFYHAVETSEIQDAFGGTGNP
jgi:hypothetical protein